MKAGDVVNAILSEDVISADEADHEAVEVGDVVFAMNNYMFQLAATGVDLGWSEITNIAQELTVPRGAINGVIKNTAIQIAESFGWPVSELAERLALNSYEAMVQIAVSIPAASQPDGLPVGVANEWQSGRRFFGPDEATILTENEQVIIPEDNTEVL